MIEPTEKFSLSRRLFHWGIALLLLIQIPLAWYMTDLPDGPGKIQTFGLHKSFGMTIFSLAVLRLVWSWISQRPALPAGTPRWEKVLAKISQAILYLLVILMPMSGWMMSSFADAPVVIFGLLELPMLVPPDPARVEDFKEMHELQSYILFTVITLHFCAALRHHCIKKNNVLNAMMLFGDLRK